MGKLVIAGNPYAINKIVVNEVTYHRHASKFHIFLILSYATQVILLKYITTLSVNLFFILTMKKVISLKSLKTQKSQVFRLSRLNTSVLLFLKMMKELYLKSSVIKGMMVPV